MLTLKPELYPVYLQAQSKLTACWHAVMQKTCLYNLGTVNITCFHMLCMIREQNVCYATNYFVLQIRQAMEYIKNRLWYT